MGFPLDALSAILKIGQQAAGNYFEVSTSGVPRLRGTATVWRDMVGDLFGRNLNSSAGKVDSNWDDNCINFDSGGSAC